MYICDKFIFRFLFFITMFLFRSIGEFIDRIFCALFAILFAQLPLYIEQYVHVLSGALAEAKLSYEDIKMRASMLVPPMTVEEFVQHHLDSEDSAFRASGEHFRESILRYEHYQSAIEQFSTCSVWSKPFVFLQNKEAHLIEALDFKPGLPFSTEGLVYVLVGAFVGFLIVSLIRGIGKKLTSKKELS